jgi:hypothetical protein
MAVPEGKRTESKLDVQTKAIELARYTKQICQKERIIPKRDRWIIANRIIDTAFTIMSSVNAANDIYVSTKGDFEERRRLQTIAMSSTAELLGLIDFAYVEYSIEGRRIRHWTKLTSEVRSLIKNWRNADKKRYQHLEQ